MGTASNVFFCHREFGDGPTPTDERREYLLFYVHILSSKINNDRLFRFAVNSRAAQQISCQSCVDVLHLFLRTVPEETVEPIVF
jgi:hypothetical protein